jgi:hypothetical protein
MLTGTGDPPRQILYGWPTLPKDPDPTWMGYSLNLGAGAALTCVNLGATQENRETASTWSGKRRMEPPAGIEPATYGLRNRRSTN